jgi:hypothetical protein
VRIVVRERILGHLIDAAPPLFIGTTLEIFDGRFAQVDSHPVEPEAPSLHRRTAGDEDNGGDTVFLKDGFREREDGPVTVVERDENGPRRQTTVLSDPIVQTNGIASLTDQPAVGIELRRTHMKGFKGHGACFGIVPAETVIAEYGNAGKAIPSELPLIMAGRQEATFC